MPDEIIIRDATPSDAAAISALITELAPYFLADPDDLEAAAPFFEKVTPTTIRDYLTSNR